MGEPTPIWIQQLAEDGLSLRGNRHLLITNNASSWEGGVVEGPWLIHREVRGEGNFSLFLGLGLGLGLPNPIPNPNQVGGEGYFFLFYSGNAYHDEP